MPCLPFHYLKSWPQNEAVEEEALQKMEERKKKWMKMFVKQLKYGCMPMIVLKASRLWLARMMKLQEQADYREKVEGIT